MKNGGSEALKETDIYNIVPIPGRSDSTISLALLKDEIEDEYLLQLIDMSLESFGKVIADAVRLKDKNAAIKILQNVYHDICLFRMDIEEKQIEDNAFWEVSEFVSNILTEELLEKYNRPDREITEFHTKIVGTTFRVQSEVDEVENGDFVLLEPEVGNDYDEYAVRVLHDKTGFHIGYIKKELNQEIWENTVNLGDLYVAMVEITGGVDGKQKGFNLTVRRIHLPQKVS